MRAYVDAAPYNTTVYNGKTHATNALSSFQQNLDYAFENYNRDSMLPINLLSGWEVSTGNPDVTKGFHQLAFASEYAMLAVWQVRMSDQTEGMRPLSVRHSSAAAAAYDLLGRPVRYVATQSQPSGIVITNGKKYMR